MKKFRFRLQTLLEQRQATEDRLLAELGEVRREEAAEQQRLGELVARLQQARQDVADALQGKADPRRVEVADEYAKALRDDVRLQELTLEAVRERVEAKRLEVVEAMKERQVLEALRDKQERGYLLAQARAEQNQLDEIASVRYARGT